MAKLYFRYGVVGSAKTLNLLATAHNYRQQGKEVLLVKPALDTRFDVNMVTTRAGLSMPADIVVPETSNFDFAALVAGAKKQVYCILVDETQFLPVATIETLHSIAHHPKHPIPVICYGLRTDFRTQLFPAAQRLLELADTIEEVKTTCVDCAKKAVFNLKLVDGKPVLDGPSIELGCEEKYLPACADCYARRHIARAMELNHA